jgi:hypothetical protein
MSICATSLLQTGKESTVSNYKSDRPYYIGEHLEHLKDFEISKYKWESNGRISMKSYRFIFVNCYKIWLNMDTHKLNKGKGDEIIKKVYWK